MDDATRQQILDYGRQGKGRDEIYRLLGGRVSYLSIRRELQTLADRPAAKYNRYKSEADPALEYDDKLTSEPEYEDDDDDPAIPWQTKSKYVYVKETDTYFVTLSSLGMNLQIPGATMRDIRDDYSNMVERALTINQMTRKYETPRRVLIALLRVFGITHDMEPFTAEELEEKPTDSLLNDLHQKKRKALFRAYERSENERIKADADKWQKFETTVLDVFQTLIATTPPPTPVRLHLVHGPETLARIADDTCLLIAPMDLHVGKRADRRDVGAAYDIAITRKLLHDSTQTILTSALMHGRPSRIVCVLGSDWFNADNYDGSTTGGTRQDMSNSMAVVLHEGYQIAVEHIMMLRAVCNDVHVVVIPGNHDRIASTMLLMAIAARFETVDGVTVQHSFLARQYHVWGETLLGFGHGDDKVKHLGIKAVMTSEAREAWGQTKHAAYFTGHLHFTEARDWGGVMCYQLPSLSAPDRWHHNQGYVMAVRGMTAFAISKRAGVVCQYHAPVVEPDGMEHNR